MQVEAYYSFRMRNLIPTFVDRGLEPAQPVISPRSVKRVEDQAKKEDACEDLSASTRDQLVKALKSL